MSTLTELSETPTAGATTKEIPVTIVRSDTDPDRPYRLLIPPDKLYLDVDWGWDGAIVFRLDVTSLPTGDSARFDTPGMTVNGGWNIMPDEADQTALTMRWFNTEETGTARPHGRSFSYRLHVLVTTMVDGQSVKMPINHDRTVHNQPPSP